MPTGAWLPTIRVPTIRLNARTRGVVMFVRTMETLAGGEWTGADTWVDVFDPVDVREPVVRVPALTAAQVTAIYDAAERGFAVWRRTPALDRAKILTKAA